MSSRLDSIVVASLKASVALLPLMMGTAFAPAYAQDTPAPANQPTAQADQTEEEDTDTKVVGASSTDKKDDGEKVVVTGTSIRNAPPTGTNLIAIDKQGIQATGANSAAELIATIPQASGGFFNEIPQLDAGGGSGQVSSAGSGTVLKPNLRATPSSATDSGSSTLILLDGQRTAGTGTIHNATDVNSMPVALLERVEINTDGGSSIYGSDGIGGVINFITRRRFEGIQLRGRYGIADDYYNYEVGGIVGHSFGKANVYVSYSRTGNDEIFNRERDYFQSIDWTTGLEVGTQCELPNVSLGTPTQFYGVDASGNIVSGPQSTAVNLCTPSADDALAGRNVRNNVLASFSYDFTDGIKLTVRGRYADSKGTQPQAAANLTSQITPANFFYQPVAANPTATQRVAYSFAPVQGDDTFDVIGRFKQYGISPELTVDVDGNWQVRGFFNWDKSRTWRNSQVVDTTTLNEALLSGDPDTAFNPYNVEDTNPALLADILDGVNQGESFNEILNSRVTIDGALFELPGGKVRMAAGLEYLKENFGVRNYNQLDPVVDGIEAVDFNKAHRNVKSVFGELNIPIVSSLNSGPLFEELRFAFSGRYDDFSDWGDNFSPRIGATYAPFKWIRFRGNWGKSFRAPTVVETLNASNSNVGVNSPAVYGFLIDTTRPGQYPIPPADGKTLNDYVALTYFGGVSDTLKPQRGTNWSVAGEIRPIDGLRAELSYYKIDYRDAIGFPNAVGLFPAYYEVVTLYPTEAEIAAFLAQAGNRETAIGEIGGREVYGLYDLRTRNLGNAKIEGLDYSARYDFNTPIGAAYISANGNIQLVNKQQPTASTPFRSVLVGTPNHRASVNVGLRSGGFRTQFTLNHTDGYKVTRTATLLQDSVGSFDVINAFFAYEFTEGELGLGSFADGLEVSLNVQNLFDTDPPIFRQRGGDGTANGSTLGRLIQIGVRKDLNLF
jgi:iron complex outermembrane receptor protein